ATDPEHDATRFASRIFLARPEIEEVATQSQTRRRRRGCQAYKGARRVDLSTGGVAQERVVEARLLAQIEVVPDRAALEERGLPIAQRLRSHILRFDERLECVVDREMAEHVQRSAVELGKDGERVAL